MARGVVVMGMSRSGTSLTTSIVASVLHNDSDAAWRGGAAPLPTDQHNTLGYFERQDVVQLNYRTLGVLGQPWTEFPRGFAARPRALNWTAAARPRRESFEGSARRIVADMEAHAPYVLKDVRFARTLPLWRPLLRGGLACVIPVRDPAEVAQSSRVRGDRVAVWRNYVLAALVSARAVGCPTMLVDFERWLSPGPAEAQLRELHAFLRCANVERLPERPPLAALRRVRPEARHHRRAAAGGGGRPAAEAECLWDELRSGRALRWAWDAARGGYRELPCGARREGGAHQAGLAQRRSDFGLG